MLGARIPMPAPAVCVAAADADASTELVVAGQEQAEGEQANEDGWVDASNAAGADPTELAGDHAEATVASGSTSAVPPDSFAASDSATAADAAPTVEPIDVARELVSLLAFLVATPYFQQSQPVDGAQLQRLLFLVEDCVCAPLADMLLPALLTAAHHHAAAFFALLHSRAGDFRALMGMLRAGSERTRLCAMRLLGYYLSSAPDSSASGAKQTRGSASGNSGSGSGIDAMSGSGSDGLSGADDDDEDETESAASLAETAHDLAIALVRPLASFAFTRATYQTLLQMALGQPYLDLDEDVVVRPRCRWSSAAQIAVFFLFPVAVTSGVFFSPAALPVCHFMFLRAVIFAVLVTVLRFPLILYFTWRKSFALLRPTRGTDPLYFPHFPRHFASSPTRAPLQLDDTKVLTLPHFLGTAFELLHAAAASLEASPWAVGPDAGGQLSAEEADSFSAPSASSSSSSSSSTSAPISLDTPPSSHREWQAHWVAHLQLRQAAVLDLLTLLHLHSQVLPPPPLSPSVADEMRVHYCQSAIAIHCDHHSGFPPKNTLVSEYRYSNHPIIVTLIIILCDCRLSCLGHARRTRSPFSGAAPAGSAG